MAMYKWLRSIVRRIRYVLDYRYPVILVGRDRDISIDEIPPGYAVIFVDGNKIELLK